MIIYTHYNLDIDAASTVALALLVNKDKAPGVSFVSADITFDEIQNRADYEDDYLILDLDCSGKGLKGETVHLLNRVLVKSAFSLYLQQQTDDIIKEVFVELAEYIDKVDTGNIKDFSITGLYKIFVSLKKSLSRHIETDREILKIWSKIIEGIYIDWASFETAKNQAIEADWPYPNIAVIRGETQPQVSSILKNKGAEFVIYKEKNNMGIIVDTTKVHPTVVDQIGMSLPGWFVHPSKFLVCWGTRKALKSSSPNITIKELSNLINEVYNE